MKIAPAQAASFLKNPPSAVRVFLVYGPDEGLVRARAQALADQLVPDKKDPFAVCELSAAALETARLLDELATPPLTGGRKLVRIAPTADSLAGAVGDFLKKLPACDSVLLLEAGDLPKKAKLRTLCEGPEPLAAALACYVEEGAARQKTIAAFFAQEKKTVSRDVLSLLMDLLPPDHLAMRAEMDKLALYTQGQETLSAEDVRAVIAGAGEADTDALIEAAAGGQPARALALLDTLWSEQTSPVTILRALQRHFTRLHLARAAMDKGQSAEAALKTLSPPVFWKSVGPMTKQLNRWPCAQIEKALRSLLDAEAASKRTGTPDKALCAHLVLALSSKKQGG